MKHGGNSRFHDCLGKVGGGDASQSDLYLSPAAETFRRCLKEIVTTSILNRTNKTTVPGSASEGGGLVSSPSIHRDVTFTDGPMGMSISRDHSGRAVVSRLVTHGPAEMKGVQVGDVVEGVGGKSMENYDQIMHVIPRIPRPLQITFGRQLSSSNSTTAARASVSDLLPISTPRILGPEGGSVAESPPVHSPTTATTDSTMPLPPAARPTDGQISQSSTSTYTSSDRDDAVSSSSSGDDAVSECAYVCVGMQSGLESTLYIAHTPLS